MENFTNIDADITQFQSSDDLWMTSAGPDIPDLPSQIRRGFRFRMSDEQARLEGGVQAAISVLGTLGNMAVVAAGTLCPRPLHGFHVLVSGVSLVDLLTCLVYVGYGACRTLRQAWLPPARVCLLMSCVEVLLQSLKAGYLFLLTCDRYTVLTNAPAHALRFSRMRMLLVSAFMWIFLFAISFPAFFSDVNADKVAVSLKAVVVGLGCGKDVVKSRTIISGLFFLLPVCITLVLCLLLICKVKRVKAMVVARNSRCSIHAILVLFFSWFATYAPMYILSILLRRATSVSKELDPAVSRGLVYLSYFSCCLTPAVLACFPRLFKADTSYLAEADDQCGAGGQLDTSVDPQPAASG